MLRFSLRRVRQKPTRPGPRGGGAAALSMPPYSPQFFVGWDFEVTLGVRIRIAFKSTGDSARS